MYAYAWGEYMFMDVCSDMNVWVWVYELLCSDVCVYVRVCMIYVYI